MRLTTKGRFAVTAMIDLALRGSEGPVFGKLRRHHLVDSVRGPGGGYCLSRPLDEISVADIIRAVDEPLDATQCGGKENCHDEHRCMTHDLWATLNFKMYEYLSSVSLHDLVTKNAHKAIAFMNESDQRVGPSPRPRAKIVAVSA
jgi:Rrf2 family iron-sulfur cluster assembly transcriptional regulator